MTHEEAAVVILALSNGFAIEGLLDPGRCRTACSVGCWHVWSAPDAAAVLAKAMRD